MVGRTRVSRKVKEDALMLEAAGMKIDDIAKTVGICTATIKRAKRKLKTTGDIEGGIKK
jgi:transposase